MTKKSCASRDRRQATTVILFLACGATLVSAQTTMPSQSVHEQYYAKVSRAPVIRPEPRTKDGAPLSTAQQSEIKKADTLYEEAVSLRESGDFETAASRASEAAQIRGAIFGPTHYESVSAAVQAVTMTAAAKLTKDQQRAFADADQKLRDWSALQQDGRYEEAREKAAAVLKYAKENLAANHPLTAWAHLRLGSTLIDIGEYDGAYAEISQSVRLLQSIYGANHPSFAGALDRLGWVNVYRAITGSGDDKTADQAVEALERAVRIYRATVGETAEAAESLDNLGTALIYVRRAGDARDSKLRALFIRETVLGPDARDTAVSLSNIAWMYEQLGGAVESLPLRERALSIFKKQLRPDHPYIALESANLAWNLHKVGRHEEAIAIYKQLIEQDRREGGVDSTNAVQRMARLGQVYAESNKIAEAKSTFDDVMKGAKALKKSGNEDQAMGTLNNVSRTAYRARMYETALAFAEMSYEWSVAAGNQVSDIERSLRGGFYGSLLTARGRPEEAKRVLSASLASLRSSGPDQQIRLAECLINLGRAEAELGEFDAAMRHGDEAMQIAESKSGRDTPATAFTKLWLGRIYTKAGNPVIAQFTFEEAQEAFDKIRERDPTGAVLVRVERAACFAAQSKQTDGLSLLREALKICRDASDTHSGPTLDASTANVLRALFDGTKSGGATESERNAWKAEAVKLLTELEGNGQLMADESAWLAAHR